MTSDVRLSEIISPAFYDVHRAVKNHDYTHYMLDGGRGSTKSSFVSLEGWNIILRNPEVNGVVLRKVGNTLRTSVFEQMLWAADALGIIDDCKIGVSPPCITYKPTRQKILFRGLDDKMKQKSVKTSKGYFGFIWYEELDEFSGMEEIRSVNQSYARGGDKFWIFYTFNPPKTRDHWTNEEKIIEYPGRLVHHSTYLTTPPAWLGEQFFEEAEALKARNPLAYEHEYLGHATGTGGAVFENVAERQITDDEISTLAYFYNGIDFGFAVDPFVWVRTAFDRKNRTLYILDEIYEQKLKNSTAVDRIRARKDGAALAYADSAEPKSIAEMNSLGLAVQPAPKGPDSVEHGIKWLQDLDSIVIDKTRTPNAYREFVMYEYEQNKDGRYISAYPDKNNHAIDAVRYALNNLIRKNSIKISTIKGF